MTESDNKDNFEKGRGFGRRAGRGQGGGRRSGGGRAGGFCVCTSCGHREQHQAGKPCFEIKCPECNTELVRE